MATYTDPTTIVSTGKPDPVLPGYVVLLVGGILSVLIGVGFFLQIMLIDRQITSTNQDATTKQQQLNALRPVADQLSELSTQAKDLHTLFDTQKRWEDVLNKVAERLHKDMAISSMQLTDKGAVTMAGIVPDYITYAKVFQAFTDTDGQKYFSAVRPTAVSRVVDPKGDYISFTFNLTLQPAVLNTGSTQATSN